MVKGFNMVSAKISALTNRIYSLILKRFHKTPYILDCNETIAEIISGKSIARFGDGELMLLMRAGDLNFQHSSELLSRRLKEVLTSNKPDLLIGLPRVFSKEDLEARSIESRKYWENNLLTTRPIWYHYISFKKLYANSTFTRNFLTNTDKSEAKQYFEKIKSIWSGRDILVVEGEYSRIGVGNDLLDSARTVKRILCPSEDAFDCYDTIYQEILPCSRNWLVLLALGPTATVLAYDLSIAGFQTVDIGHVDIEYEWCLHNAESKTKIPGKYVGEAGGVDISCEDYLKNDPDYSSQIVKVIQKCN